MSYPIFLDFEASSLSEDSYPIEMAWNTPSGKIFSYLIKPDAQWLEWSEQSEKIHGISREQLLDEGVAITDLCQRVEEQLSHQELFSDAVNYEHHWMLRLFQAGGRDTYPFTIKGISNIPKMNRLLKQPTLYRDWKTRAQQAIGVTHRAAADVEALMHVYNVA